MVIVALNVNVTSERWSYPVEIRSLFNASPAAVGDRLRRRRLEAGATLSDYATLADVSLRALHHWEVGDNLPTVGELARYCRVIDCNPVFALLGVPAGLDEDFVTQEAQKNLVAESEIRIWDYVSTEPAAIGQRLRQAREARKVTLAELGRQIRKTRQGVLHWESGKNNAPIVDLMAVIAFIEADPIYIVFGFRYSLQIDGEEDLLPPQDYRKGMPRPIFVCQPAEPAPQSEPTRGRSKILGRPVPLLEGGYENPKIFETADAVPPKKLRKILTQADCSDLSFAMFIEDDRNEPDINKGDVIVVDPLEECKPGRTALARHRNSIVIGEVRIKNKHHIILAKNKEWDDETLHMPEGLVMREHLGLVPRRTRDHIIGIVVEHVRKMS